MTLDFFKYTVMAAVCAVFLWVIARMLRYHTVGRRVAMLALGAALTLYLGVSATSLIVLVFLASFTLGSIYFKFHDHLLAFVAGFFTLLQIYIGVSIVVNPMIALYAVCALSLGLLLRNLTTVKSFFSVQSLDAMFSVLISFNIIELFFLLLVLVYSSLPQSSFNWDSVYANLYNAKWYIESNTLKPIEESISSFFPQHAVVYYSMFYAMGRFHGLQVAYILPLLLLLGVVRKFVASIKASRWYRLVFGLLVLCPIVFMESVSGYYDLLIAVCILLSVYVLGVAEKLDVVRKTLLFCLCIGFAAASKYFALALVPALSVVLLDKEFLKITLKKRILLIFAGVLLLVAPLTYWMARAYIYTGSPVFPMFQKYFRTPEYWEVDSSVDQNAMTQTTMSAMTWLKGGVFAYPVLTYLNSNEFVEATKGFPGLIYVFLIPVQLISLGIALKHVMKRKATPSEVVVLAAFVGMVIVGLVVRYYRYIWPFQLGWTVLTLTHAWGYVKKIRVPMVLLVFALVGLYTVQYVDLLDSMHFSPQPQKRQLFRPDALSVYPQDAMWDILNMSQTDEPVLDATARIYLPRVYIRKKTYQCDWYWVSGDKKVKELATKSDEEIEQFLSQFSFIITGTTQKPDDSYCAPLLERAKNLRKVYSGGSYTLYAVD